MRSRKIELLDDEYFFSLLSPRDREAAATQADVVVWTKVLCMPVGHGAADDAVGAFARALWASRSGPSSRRACSPQISRHACTMCVQEYVRSQVGLPLQDTAPRRPPRPSYIFNSPSYSVNAPQSRMAFQPLVPLVAGLENVAPGDADYAPTAHRGPTSECGGAEAPAERRTSAEITAHLYPVAPASLRAAPPRAQRSAPPQAPDAHQDKGASVAMGDAEQQQGGQWGECNLVVCLFLLSVLVSASCAALWAQSRECSTSISKGGWDLPQALHQVHALMAFRKCAAAAVPEDGVLARARSTLQRSWGSTVGRVRRSFARMRN
jgi:hypothetical protein